VRRNQTSSRLVSCGEDATSIPIRSANYEPLQVSVTAGQSIAVPGREIRLDVRQRRMKRTGCRHCSASPSVHATSS
jgi:hypothetical protein